MMNKSIIFGLLFSGVLYASGNHTGNHMHQGKMTNHSNPQGKSSKQPTLTEAGNDAFGTIQEIVKKLSDNPNTNWKNVNIEALRAHLIDMHDMTINVEVISQKNIPNGLVTIVQATTPRASGALQRVFKAHPGMLKIETNWDMKIEKYDNKYTLTITTKNADEIDKIRGLGYIGIMSYGAHHQPHHWMMATGHNPH